MAKKLVDESPVVTVQATANLNEDGVFYAPGDKFQTTADRADALGPLVKPASEEPA